MTRSLTAPPNIARRPTTTNKRQQPGRPRPATRPHHPNGPLPGTSPRPLPIHPATAIATTRTVDQGLDVADHDHSVNTRLHYRQSIAVLGISVALLATACGTGKNASAEVASLGSTTR